MDNLWFGLETFEQPEEFVDEEESEEEGTIFFLRSMSNSWSSKNMRSLEKTKSLETFNR